MLKKISYFKRFHPQGNPIYSENSSAQVTEIRLFGILIYQRTEA